MWSCDYAKYMVLNLKIKTQFCIFCEQLNLKTNLQIRLEMA